MIGQVARIAKWIVRSRAYRLTEEERPPLEFCHYLEVVSDCRLEPGLSLIVVGGAISRVLE